MAQSSDLAISILGENFRLGTSQLVEPQGLTEFEVDNVQINGRALGIQAVVERRGYYVSWISWFVRYLQATFRKG